MKKLFILLLPTLLSLTLSAQIPTTSNAIEIADRSEPLFYEDFENGIPSTWWHYYFFMSDVLDGSVELTPTNTNSYEGCVWQESSGKSIGYGLPTQHMMMSIMTNYAHNMVVTPEISVGANSYLSFDMSLNYNNTGNQLINQFPFMANLNGEDDKFAVMIKVGDRNWSQLALWDNQGAARVYNAIDQYPQTITIPIHLLHSTTIRLAFYGESTEANAVNALRIDNVGVWPATGVVPPNGITINKTSNGAQVSWNAQVGASSYSLQYKSIASESWTTISNLTSNSYVLSGLDPEQFYKLRIKTFGAQQAESMWSDETFFRTAPNYDSYPIPFVETFTTNNIPENWTRRADPATYVVDYGGCHPKEIVIETGQWNCKNTAQSFKHYHAKAECFSMHTGWLITPNIDLSSATNPDDLCLVFDIAFTAKSGSTSPPPMYPLPDDDDEFRVLVSSDAGETWAANYTWKRSGGDFDIGDIATGTGISTIRIPLSDFTDEDVMIAFYSGSEKQIDSLDIEGGFNIHIDNIFVGEASHVFATEGDWNNASCWVTQAIPSDLNDNVLVKANTTIPTGCAAEANNIAFYTKTVGSESIEYTPTLTIADGGQLKHNSDGVMATVQKDIQLYTTNDKWYLLASPIIESITPTSENGLLVNNYDLYIFDQSEEGEEWRNFEANTFSTLNNKIGYLYANNGNTTIELVGNLAANVEATPLAYDENADWKGFNLIGNPYPCNAYVDRSFYVLDGNGVRFIPGSGAIPPCSAILVEAQGANESVSFSKTPIRREGLAISVVKAEGRANSCLDKACVSFKENDVLTKYSPNTDESSLYIPQDGRNFAVACALGQNELPVNFVANKNDKYTLTIEVENKELDYLHLIDNLTGVETDLLQQPSYSFEAKTTDYPSRFRLVFSADESEMASEEESFAFFTNGQLFIPFVEDESQLQIIDMTGRVLCNECFCGSYTKQLQLPAGVYVMQLVSNHQQKTQKIVVE